MTKIQEMIELLKGKIELGKFHQTGVHLSVTKVKDLIALLESVTDHIPDIGKKAEPEQTEFTKNWKEKRQLFADLKPVGDELDYMHVVCSHIRELLIMGDGACGIIDRLTAENKVQAERIKKLEDIVNRIQELLDDKKILTYDDFEQALEGSD